MTYHPSVDAVAERLVEYGAAALRQTARLSRLWGLPAAEELAVRDGLHHLARTLGRLAHDAARVGVDAATAEPATLPPYRARSVDLDGLERALYDLTPPADPALTVVPPSAGGEAGR